ncbi:hypothetical protein ACFL52_00820 [Candidatus Margulisiibacteriota bacterium]
MTQEALSLQNTPIITFGYIMQVFLSLAIVLGLIYVASKYLLPRFKMQNMGQSVKIVERIGLEPGVSAYMIKSNNKSYLVAVSQKNMLLLDSFEEEA